MTSLIFCFNRHNIVKHILIMKKTFLLILKVLGTLLIIPASLALIMALFLLITGEDGFSDAAPWWVIFMMIAGALGLPGLILLFIARYISKSPEQEK